MGKVNSYNVFDENECSTILYHAVARDEDHVKEMAVSEGIDLQGLTIEIARKDVKDELGRPFKPYIQDALIH